MRLKNNQAPHRRQFEQELAQYRALVYESHFLHPNPFETDIEECMNSQSDGPSILVIEDNADDWFMLRWGLTKKFPKATLTWLTDAHEIIPRLDSCVQTEALPQLILLDLYLPSLEQGLAVLLALKSHQRYHRLPVIVNSRSTDPADITAVFTYPVNSFIVKPAYPMEWPELLTPLDSYLNKGPSALHR